MTADQLQAFLAAVREDRLYALYLLAATTGMRQGELLALQWSDIQLENRALMVGHTLGLDDAGNRVRLETKTASSRRRIELSGSVVQELVKLRERRLGEGLRSSPWVFCDTAGGPINKDNLVHGSFLPAMKDAGLPRMRFHDLRHTAASLMLTRGVHAKVVQEMLGHTSIKMTLDTYGHLLPSMHREAADLIERVLAY